MKRSQKKMFYTYKDNNRNINDISQLKTSIVLQHHYKKQKQRFTMPIYSTTDRWDIASTNDPLHTMCYDFWTLLDFDGRYTQFVVKGVLFRNGAHISLPGGQQATLISLQAVRQSPTVHSFIGVMNESLTLIFLENRTELLPTWRSRNRQNNNNNKQGSANAAADDSTKPAVDNDNNSASASGANSADDNGGDQTTKNND